MEISGEGDTARRNLHIMLLVVGVNLLSLTAIPSAPLWSAEIDELYLFVCIRTDVL